MRDPLGHHVRVRPRVWFFVLLIMSVSAAAVLAWFLTREGREHADQWASIIFGATAAAAVLVTALRWLWLRDSGRDGTVTAERLAAAQAVLARAQTEQWTAEEVARQLQDPWPLQVRWQVSRRARQVMVSWAAVRGVPNAGESRIRCRCCCRWRAGIPRSRWTSGSPHGWPPTTVRWPFWWRPPAARAEPWPGSWWPAA